MADWLRYEQAITVRGAAASLPQSPGKYAFFIDQLENLPELFRVEALTRANSRLLYIGKTDSSLFVRVWEQECQHLRPGTFFRSIGAMLGYKSPDGGRNYEFSYQDRQRVVDWIKEHLLVAWDSSPTTGSHLTGEKTLIRQHKPLLNIKDNPLKFRELERLREICRIGQPT